MALKVFTKSGETYTAPVVDQAGPFVQMKFWDGEVRIPAGEVAKMQTVGMSGMTGFQAWLVVFLVSLIFWISILV